MRYARIKNSSERIFLFIGHGNEINVFCAGYSCVILRNAARIDAVNIKSVLRIFIHAVFYYSVYCGC